MNKYRLHIAVALLASLYIYGVFRTERTLVNQLIAGALPRSECAALRQALRTAMPLPPWVVYALPQGLWVFCITITSGFVYVERGGQRWSLRWLPLAVAAGFELLQWSGLLHGRFDAADLATSLGCWAAACFLTRRDEASINLRGAPPATLLPVTASYAVVYLAHVVR